MNYRKEQAQMIVLMGVILTVAVVLIAAISAELANQSIGTLKSHAKGLLPKYQNIRARFSEVLNDNLNRYGDINVSFNKTYQDFYTGQIQQGNYFTATLNQYKIGNGASGLIRNSMMPDEENVFFVNITLSLDDGITCITERNIIYPIFYRPWRILDS